MRRYEYIEVNFSGTTYIVLTNNRLKDYNHTEECFKGHEEKAPIEIGGTVFFFEL